MEDYVIYHHGIKGQRWGVRRFQNEDGTRTPAGLKREQRLNNRADKYESKKNAEIEKMNAAKTRLGKHIHNQKAFNAQVKENVLRDRASAKTLSEKLGATLGNGGVASVADASEDFFARQKEYRTTKLGKHLSAVNEYNAHEQGKSSEKIYQTKGLVNKGKAYTDAALNTKVKTLAGRETKSAERIVDAAIMNLTEKMGLGKVSVSTIMDAAYLGSKVLDKTKKAKTAAATA